MFIVIHRIGQIACGENHSLAVRSGGRVFSWGANVNSQLGDGTNANRNTPVLLALPVNVVSIAGGARHTAATDASANIFIFGDNFYGQVGNNRGNYNPNSATLNALRGDSNISGVVAGSVTLVGTGSFSGSGVVRIAGLATGFDFGPLTTNATVAVKGTFANQSAELDIQVQSLQVFPPGEFSLTHQCPATLPKATQTVVSQCEFDISFVPAAEGDRVGRVEIASNVEGSPQVLSLSGVGVLPARPALSLATSFVSFIPQDVGSVVGPSAISIKNTGNATLSVTNIAPSSTNFSTTHNCGSVAAGASCTLNLSFNPTETGALESTITINSNAVATDNTAGQYFVRTSGTGVPVTPASVPFAPTISSITASSGQLTIFFTAPAFDGGAPVTGYSISCVGPATVTIPATSSPVTVTGLTNGQSYACTLVAINSIGRSSASTAVNSTPSITPAIGIVGVFSRKVHNGVTYNLPLDLSQQNSQNVTIEPRSIGTGHRIAFQFNQTITQPGSVTAFDSVTGSIVNIGIVPGANEVIINLPSVPDNRRVSISLSNVNGAASVVAAIGFLVGDVTNSRRVNASDIAAMKAHVGQAVGAGNYRYDTNLSGTISSADVSAVKARSGWMLP